MTAQTERPRRSGAGFTLVEEMVAAAVLVVIMASLVAIIKTAVEAIGTAKVRAVAAQVAQDRIELAHNVVYDHLGTVGGIPAGDLPQTETVAMGGQTFNVLTSVVYVDDPADQSAPQDPIPTDYKRVRVEVTWQGAFRPGSSVVLWTDIAPKGLETMVNAGTLSILVFNAVGVPEQNAVVTIVADTTTPPVNLTTYTDAQGMIMLPGAPVCNECYRISATKAGYTTDRTYGTSEVTNPLKPHASVLNGLLTNVSFAIDRTATLVLKAVRYENGSYVPFMGVQMRVRGAKEIGRTATDDPVYKYDRLATTWSGGQVTVNDMEWDSYQVSLPVGSTVDYAGSTPTLPLNIQPSTSTTFIMVVVANSNNSYLATLMDQNQAPLASGSVTMVNQSTLDIATKSAGILGAPDQSQVFFPNLLTGMYDLSATSSGYKEATASVNIAGDMRETYILQPQ